MLWIGIGIALALVFVVIAVMVAKGSGDDLGSVSEHWVSQHRADAP